MRGLGSDWWHRDEIEGWCGCGCWGVGGDGIGFEGVVRNRGRTGQGNLPQGVCVGVPGLPAEPTGGTRTHTEAHPLDLSGPPARTQPTSPPHLAYLRWDMWAAWGPCKNMSVHVIFPVLGLMFACPFGGGASRRVVCLRSVLFFSLLSVWWDSLVAGERGIEARHTSWCER